MKKFMTLIILASMLFLNSCGTIFYPERRGNSHDIDTGVAVLDGIGLIFFLVPGIVAYAVDFSTGCIYLRGGGHHAKNSLNTEIVPLDGVHDINQQVNQALYANYGITAAEAQPINGVVGFNNWWLVTSSAPSS